jgi:hypothetical protein
MISKFLKENNWIRYESATDGLGNPVPYYDSKAKYFDVSSAFKLYYQDNEYEKVVIKFKNAYRSLFPEKYKKCKVNYRGDCGPKVIYPLYLLNDNLEFKELKRIFKMIQI